MHINVFIFFYKYIIACTAKGKDLRTHWKNTFHVGRAIKGMLLNKSEEYLKDVFEHK